MLEYWKRLEKRKAMEWGNVGYEEEEEDRPEFKGDPYYQHTLGEDRIHNHTTATNREPDVYHSLIDGEISKYVDKNLSFRRSIFSVAVLTLLSLCVVGLVFAIFFHPIYDKIITKSKY